MYGSFVIRPDGSERKVKNLGWLLRHWRDVDRLTIKTFPTHAAVLTAHMRDGTRYVTGWASTDVMVEWLHRPVFYCTRVRIDGMDCVVRPPSGCCYEGPAWQNRWVAP